MSLLFNFLSPLWADSAFAYSYKCQKLAGMKVATWMPDESAYPAPLILFSHGYHGINVQCGFAKKLLAQNGYIVVAPNHKDAIGAPGSLAIHPIFARTKKWNHSTFEYRADDIKNLLAYLKEDPQWRDKIDWDKIGICGTSLGGYTVLGLAGAWPEQKLPEAKCVLAQAPFTKPLLEKDLLARIDIPVMYQGGGLDFLTPEIRKKGGAYDSTPSPAYYVEFKRATHLFWSVLNFSKKRQNEMSYYNLAFFDKYLKGIDDGRLAHKTDNASQLKVK
ncbi:MAG: dienelactone hydrolase family protein [Candidatus Melainabacteria bacterium]|nr:dienelactone hydrolase family protein [Candidatus Melainabacteria bacterium]